MGMLNDLPKLVSWDKTELGWSSSHLNLSIDMDIFLK